MPTRSAGIAPTAAATSSASTAAGTAVPGSRRRSGQARWQAHRTRRGRQRAAEPSRRRRRRRGRPQDRQPGTRSSSATWPAPTPTSTSRRRTRALTEQLPAALVPRLALVDELPTRTSGKVDRNALPWPPAGYRRRRGETGLEGTQAWVAGLWTAILGAEITGPDDDFFELGGGSLSAAQLVTALRERFPEVTVAQLYDHPRLGSLAEYLDELAPIDAAEPRIVTPTPRRTQLAQIAATVPLTTLTGLQWVTWLAIANNVFVVVRRRAVGADGVVVVDSARVLRLHQPGRPDGDLGDRLADRCCADSSPGTYPRGGSEHLRLWVAQRLTEASGAANLSGAPWMLYYARALGAKRRPAASTCTRCRRSPACSSSATVAPSNPRSTCPGTGSTATSSTSVRSRSVPGASVGARSTLIPGATHRARTPKSSAGSAVFGRVKANQQLGRFTGGQGRQGRPPVARGDPAPRGLAGFPRSASRPMLIAGLPIFALVAGIVLIGWWIRDAGTTSDPPCSSRCVMLPVATLVSLAVFASLTLVSVRLLSHRAARGLPPGPQPHRLAGVGHRATAWTPPARSCSRCTRVC